MHALKHSYKFLWISTLFLAKINLQAISLTGKSSLFNDVGYYTVVNLGGGG